RKSQFIESTRYRRNSGAPYLTCWDGKASLVHQNVKEETMKTFVLASVLGLVLACPAAGYASNGAVTPLHHHPLSHHEFVPHRQAVDPRAVAYAPFLGLLPYTSGVYSDSGHQTDGLSRSPNDCVRW